MHGGFKTQTIREAHVDFSDKSNVLVDGQPLEDLRPDEEQAEPTAA